MTGHLIRLAIHVMPPNTGTAQLAACAANPRGACWLLASAVQVGAILWQRRMRRAIETAEIIGGPHKITPTVRDGIREIHHGHWETLSRSEVEAQFPEEYAEWQMDPFTFAPEGGESGLVVMARALPVIREIVVDHVGETVAVVSHKATIRLLLSSLLGFDARGYRDRLEQSPCCLNILDFKDPVRARLMLFNDVSHYVDQPPYSERRLSKWWDSTAAGSK